MKIVLAVVLMLAIVTASALAQEMAPMAVPGAFAEESSQFSMASAFYLLSNFIQQGADETKAAFEARGFEVLFQDHYGKPAEDHTHTSAYTVAQGQMEIRGRQRNVVVVTIRGTVGGEWYSNFDFAWETGGECEYAENYMAAAMDIYAQARKYIDAAEDPVVIACGYSRGAACANLLGMLLDDEYGMDDIYVYTFATPNTVRGEKGDYGNIFNLVNVNDMVTRMPPAPWGFSRLGVDIELRDPEFMNLDMHNMFLALLGLCPDIDAYYNDLHSLEGYGLSEVGMSTFELFQCEAGILMGGDERAKAQAALSLVMEKPNDFTEFFTTFMQFSEAEGPGLGMFGQHMPDVYIQLMMSMQ